MVSFEITWSTIENPAKCTVVGSYSGKHCPNDGSVALDVVAKFADGRPDVLYRKYRVCPEDAMMFLNGFKESGSPVVMIETVSD